MPQMKSLRILPDFLDQAAHNEMDQEIWKILQRRFRAKDNADVVEQLSSVNADDLRDKQETFGALLHAILFPTTYRNNKIENEYLNLTSCEDVFSGDHAKDVLQLLQTCAQKGTFADIRNFSLFRRPVATEDANFVEAQEKATVSAWSRTFYGTAHQLLYKNIKSMSSSRRKDQLYSNYVSIVQSSGTGKSRTVDEMARLVFTFPFNLRAEGNSGYAYPAADCLVRDFLLEEGSRKKPDSIVAAYLIFFRFLFERTAERLHTLGNSAGGQTAIPHQLAEEWRAHLAEGNTRSEFYNEVVRLVTDSTEWPSITKLKQNEDDIKISSYAQPAIIAGKRLSDIINSYAHDKLPDSLRLVMYFDEAHSLMQHSTEGINSHLTRYHALCKAINQLTDVPLFVVMLSTTSQLHNLSPAKMFHPSMRVQGGKQDDLQAPITEMPFDLLCDNEPLVPPEGVTLDDACELKFICRFGRPLWRAFFMSEDTDVQRMLVDTASSKLTGYRRGPQTDDEDIGHGKRALLAALSTRLLLEFEPARELARKMEVELVESNLRIAYSVPKHREYFRSGYPSEPILAEAAARFLNGSKFSVPDSLTSFVKSGLISKGERGELVMRLLLLEAFDKATRKTFENVNDRKSMTFDHPIPVIDFLKALFGEKNMKTVLDKDARNRANWRTFEKAFGNAYVHFTHFGKSENESVSNQFGAWAAIMRGMAIQCSTNQRNIDCIIPIVFGRKEKITPDRMSAILIQVKNRVDSQVLAIDEKKLDGVDDFFRKGNTGLPDNRPYITIAMHLGIQDAAYKDALPKAKLHELEASFECVAPTGHMLTRTASSKRMETLYDPKEDLHPREGLKGGDEDPPHPRYEIVVKKCNPETFAAMIDDYKRASEEKATHDYAYLLAGTSVYDEHPRQDEENLAAVRKLKSGWSIGDDYYDWTGNDFLCGGTPGRSRNESNDSEDADPMQIVGADSPEDIVMGSQNSD
ncbi:uncharacterized protein LAESUDRAFT_732934 [Laetiporus sulphureus 93-53]|uniref:Uncharacterized protein n=1 Tax=Laetiporus sulphureus 93-53 TaxID=1314785 RepID=A0A165AV67_9APHY|nr:uncharacterized protein LAESUDRAFT_732934 [Laetiporus sulphureus 93-53]KZS99725.1 hypothetical protein LAESUDRAFT_732934 [Laetiporus sulphureus 93-53]